MPRYPHHVIPYDGRDEAMKRKARVEEGKTLQYGKQYTAASATQWSKVSKVGRSGGTAHNPMNIIVWT